MWFNKKKKNTEEIVDEELIKRIEPRGGITFKNEKHILQISPDRCEYFV